MKPRTTLASQLVVTVALVLGMGYLASVVPEGAGIAQASDNVADDTGLVIDVTGVRSRSGKVLVAVFDEPVAFQNYDYEGATAFMELAAEAGNVRAHFPELRAGPYAISLFHDENGDYEFNMDGMLPLEGYGTSGARDAYHEPSFEEAAVANGRFTVPLHYL